MDSIESLIVGLTGLAGSGKGEVSRYLEKVYGFNGLVFSDVLREEAEKTNLLKGASYERQKYLLSKLGEQMRREYGMDVLARSLVERIESERLRRAVVDGFRSVEEVDLFRDNFNSFSLVYIKADENVRLLRRKAQDPTTTLEDMKRRDRENIEFMGLGRVIGMADFTIVNNYQGLEDLRKDVDDFMRKIDS